MLKGLKHRRGEARAAHLGRTVRTRRSFPVLLLLAGEAGQLAEDDESLKKEDAVVAEQQGFTGYVVDEAQRVRLV